jgi:hypothetical protein
MDADQGTRIGLTPRARAPLGIARIDPPPAVSSQAAVVAVAEVLGSIGDTCPNAHRGKRRTLVSKCPRLSRQLVPGVGVGVIDPYLKHWETALQFYRAELGAFLSGELGLHTSVDLDGKTGFGQLDRSGRHSNSFEVGVAPSIWLR